MEDYDGEPAAARRLADWGPRMSAFAGVACAVVVVSTLGGLFGFPDLALSQTRGKESVPEIEDRLLRQLQTEGVGPRFHIKEIKPRCYSRTVLRYTKSKDQMRGEFDEDRFGLAECAVGIYRYAGEVKMGPYTFIGEGDKTNRLTFAFIDSGYVYLRGKGKVVLPDGRTVSLGR